MRAREVAAVEQANSGQHLLGLINDILDVSAIEAGALELHEENAKPADLVEESVRRNVEFRQAQKAFIERGLASAEATKKSGRYVSSATVLGKLARRLEKARKGRGVAAA